MTSIDKFLRAYSEYLGWDELPNPPKGSKAIMRRLCEEYHYSPKHSREFLLIAFGWIWGNCKAKFPFINGNCYSGLLQVELDKVYKEVAKENDWDEEDL